MTDTNEPDDTYDDDYALYEDTLDEDYDYEPYPAPYYEKWTEEDYGDSHDFENLDDEDYGPEHWTPEV